MNIQAITFPNDTWDEEINAALFSANAAYAPAPPASSLRQ
jgi:hypothetical protein